MFHIVLYQPEIPPNTGNIIRLCANTGSDLHLIRPLGFDLNNSRLRRAGLDYAELARVRIHDSLQLFFQVIEPQRLFALTTKARRNYTDVCYEPGDALLFGPETRGLPDSVLDSMPEGHLLRIPMRPGSRSINLANSAAVILYEALRQTGFHLR